MMKIITVSPETFIARAPSSRSSGRCACTINADRRLALITITNRAPLTTTEFSMARRRSRAHPAAEDAEEDSAKGADGRCFRRTENPGVNASDRQDEKRNELPRLAHG